MRESWRLEFQADAFNLFNWVRFSGPAINVTSSNFGKIGGQSNAPRVAQFSARIVF